MITVTAIAIVATLASSVSGEGTTPAVPGACYDEAGVMHEAGSSWELGSCMETAFCDNGRISVMISDCYVHMVGCPSRLNPGTQLEPVDVEGQCCPACPTETDTTTPETAQADCDTGDISCMLWCDPATGGFAVDENGCQLCACAEPPPTLAQVTQRPTERSCPPVCAIACEHGHVLDANDCPTCSCNQAPVSMATIVGEGERCIGSVAPQFQRLCADGLSCVMPSPPMPGASGTCVADAPAECVDISPNCRGLATHCGTVNSVRTACPLTCGVCTPETTAAPDEPTDCESCEAAGRAWSVGQCFPGPDCLIADVACYGGNSGASCTDRDPVCGDQVCMMYCEHGYAVDDDGCQLCECLGRPSGPTVVGEGEECNGSLPPQFATICDDGYDCIQEDESVAGAAGTCVRDPSYGNSATSCGGNPATNPDAAVANCQAAGDTRAFCVYGHHCGCTAEDGYVCEDGRGGRECAPGDICVPATTTTTTTDAPEITTAAATTREPGTCPRNCGAESNGGGTCRSNGRCLSCNANRVLQSGRCYASIACKGRRIQTGSQTGSNCRCLDDGCHYCNRLADGDTCRVCRDGTYLLDGACVETCPTGMAQLGIGNFKRRCMAPFECQRGRIIGMDVGYGCKCANDDMTPAACHFCSFRANEFGQHCTRCNGGKFLRADNRCHDNCDGTGMIAYTPGNYGRECRAPFTCTDRQDENGNACKCSRAVGGNSCTACDYQTGGVVCQSCAAGTSLQSVPGGPDRCV